jgi:hypothetical protein
MDAASTDRMKTASATLALLDKIRVSDPPQVVPVLASAAVATSAAAMGECFEKAEKLAGVLEGANWEVFEAISKLADERKAQAEGILTSVREVLKADEHVQALGPALKSTQAKALRLLTEISPPPPPPPPPLPPIDPDDATREQGALTTGSRENLSLADARDQLDKLKSGLQAGQEIIVNLSWRIMKKGASS